MPCKSCSGRVLSQHSSWLPLANGRAAPMCLPEPACPECGGLDALCRPRWVAGMVVNEADLNRLDHYVTAKHRLHNRFVHGVGVVCGLMVTCHPCGEGIVSIAPGLCHGPCGEDIVVPRRDDVDVCALIRQCRELERRDVECGPWGARADCKDLEETWVLAIRYDERPSRNDQLLRAGERRCECDCGGAGECRSSGDCHCGGGCGNQSRAKSPRRDMPTACAPTVLCETYRYEVFRAPPGPNCDPRQRRSELGALGQRIEGCLKSLLQVIRDVPVQELSPRSDLAARQAWSRFCNRVKAAIQEQLSGVGVTRCDLLNALCSVPCPSPQLQEQAFVDAVQASFKAMAPVLLTAVKDCICLSLLPPCPEPVHDPRLPLALVTVSGGADCRVTDICNWTPLRRMVGTFPNVAYWLSFLNLVEQLRTTLFCLCCAGEVPELPEQFRRMDGMFAREPGAGGPADADRDAFERLRAAGIDLDELSRIGGWLERAGQDPSQLFSSFAGTVGLADGIDDLRARLNALEREIAELRARGPNG